ncbi:MAG TPA: BTAD domain-containing putative transcriptional regulator [Streptosporangiaceae bacterium]
MSRPRITLRILGPLTAELGPAGSGARPVELDTGPFKQRLLLALLLCRSGGVVLTEQLVDALWWDGPPRTAHKNIHVYVTHLRKILAADGQSGRLRYRPPGYQLRMNADELDALRFEDLSRTGRLALRQGDARGAAAATRKALGLWRGPALADLTASPPLRDEATRLEDRRLAAFEDWFEAELLLGNNAEVLGEIEAVVRAHPLRERLRGIQLTALYRSGRQAEALAEYDNLRQLLAAELGLGPSPVLHRLYQDILSGDPAIAGFVPAGGVPASGVPASGVPAGGVPASGVRPDTGVPPVTALAVVGDVVAHLADPADSSDARDVADVGRTGGTAGGTAGGAAGGLPRAAGDFTGRGDVLRELLSFFDPEEPSRRTPAALGDRASQRQFAAVVGPPGSGTTTLALCAAHLLAPRFRHGAVLLPLRAADGMPRSLAELSGDLLSRLKPFTVPMADDRTTAVRSRLAALELLLILDGVADERQVRPLLPGAGGCSVIITSCRSLGGLDGITRFRLGPFTEDEALELLGRIAGAERIRRAEPAARRIVRSCGLLPLAVRVAGARLAGLTHLPVEHFAARLEDDDRLLDELSAGDLSVRECFDRYVRGLDVAERLALTQVAAAWGPLSKGPGELERLLERLAEVHALTIADGGRRAPVRPLPFAMPAPLWLYAQQMVTADARC